jgi:hypothetical protein
MPTLAERLGLNPARIRAEAEASYKAKCARETAAVLTGKAAPLKSERAKVRVRKTKTHYLDGEEQRRIKRQLREHHTTILSLLLHGVPVSAIATLYGVTDMAIYNRAGVLGGLFRKRKLPGALEADETNQRGASSAS